MKRADRIQLVCGVLLLLAGLAFASLAPGIYVMSRSAKVASAPTTIHNGLGSPVADLFPGHAARMGDFAKAQELALAGYAVAGIGFLYSLFVFVCWFVGPAEKPPAGTTLADLPPSR